MKKYLFLISFILLIILITGCPDTPPDVRTVTEVTTDNDLIESAQDLGTLTGQIIINGSISGSSYDVDFYKFNTGSKSAVSITVTWTITPAKNMLDLYFYYNPALSEIASADTTSTTGEALTNQAVTANSIYYFDLSGIGTATGDYTVTIE